MAVALFRHPHLIRGIVHTPFGAVMLDRGVAELPQHVGESLGWVMVPDEDESLPRLSGSGVSVAHHSDTPASDTTAAKSR
jgi:hypothetical protein